MKIKKKKEEKFGVQAVTGRGERASLVGLLGLILARSRTAKLLLFILVIYRNAKYASKWSKYGNWQLALQLSLSAGASFSTFFSRARVEWLSWTSRKAKDVWFWIWSASRYCLFYLIIWSPKMNPSSRSISAQSAQDEKFGRRIPSFKYHHDIRISCAFNTLPKSIIALLLSFIFWNSPSIMYTI